MALLPRRQGNQVCCKSSINLPYAFTLFSCNIRIKKPQKIVCRLLNLCHFSTIPLFFPSNHQPLSAHSLNFFQPEEMLRCRATSLEPTGLYLLHAPLALLLWVGSQVPAHTLVELFNSSCFMSLPSGEVRHTRQLQHFQWPIKVMICLSRRCG